MIDPAQVKVLAESPPFELTTAHVMQYKNGTGTADHRQVFLEWLKTGGCTAPDVRGDYYRAYNRVLDDAFVKELFDIKPQYLPKCRNFVEAMKGKMVWVLERRHSSSTSRNRAVSYMLAEAPEDLTSAGSRTAFTAVGF